jgi:multiple sugar transport system substrate-binding protein
VSEDSRNELPIWEQPIDRKKLLARAGGAGAALALGGLAVPSLAGASSRDNGTVSVYFGQHTTIPEQDALRNIINPHFTGKINGAFAAPGTQFTDRPIAEQKAGNIKTDVLLSLHGDFVSLQNAGALRDVSDLAAQLKGVVPDPLMNLGKLGTNKQWYIPFEQATYIMVANRSVLKLLPKGADMEALTYGQLLGWAKNIKQSTGQARFGLPASDLGLIHRFFQGFTVPSYSGGMVTTFRSPLAVASWQYLSSLWNYTHPQSLTYSFMQDPLLSGEVLLAWDHVARLKTALDQKPDELVAFPVPRGPKARSYMPVVVGLAIPAGSTPNLAGAKAYIKFMLSISTQAQILSLLGFLPIVPGHLSKRISPGLLAEAAAVRRQTKAKDAVQALLPVGIQDQGGNFNKIYRDTFTRTVLNHEPIQNVLNEQGNLLQAIFDKTGAPCWSPDPPSGTAACKVK